VPIPQLMLSAVLEKFWIYTKDRILNKSPDQVRKWENPRKKAVNNFLCLIGDKALSELTREDLIDFRAWWIGLIEDGGKKQGSANKDFGHLKDVLETVSENLKLNLPIEHLFKKIAFRNVVETSRPPFTNEQILAILHSLEIEKLNPEAKYFLYAMAETGARNSEILGLLPEEVHLGAPIPFIQIKPRKGKGLKTKHSVREIPLVGYALEAFKAMPNGFSHYRDKPDNLTNFLNRFLREHDLLPSEKHTVYSLRHSFQDRILSVNTPDRIQAELMGHKFGRPKYGEGGTLQQKKEWLDRVCLKGG
jgi:integrase